jgi:hypothetical protein
MPMPRGTSTATNPYDGFESRMPVGSRRGAQEGTPQPGGAHRPRNGYLCDPGRPGKGRGEVAGQNCRWKSRPTISYWIPRSLIGAGAATSTRPSPVGLSHAVPMATRCCTNYSIDTIVRFLGRGIAQPWTIACPWQMRACAPCLIRSLNAPTPCQGQCAELRNDGAQPCSWVR